MDRRSLPRPGWYSDPEGEVRWWDGEAWTDQVRAQVPSFAVDVVPAAQPARPAAAPPAPAAPAAPAAPQAPVPAAAEAASMAPAPPAPVAPAPVPSPAPFVPAAASPAPTGWSPAAAAAEPEEPRGGVAVLDRPEPAPVAVLPPSPSRRSRPRRGRRFSPLLVVAALVGVVGVLVAYAFSAGLLGAAAEPPAPAAAQGQLASEIVSEPGTGTLAESPRPEKGFVGKTQLFEAIGYGTWLSPGFLLGPGETSVVYKGEGARGDVVLRLVPQFPVDPSQSPGETGCYAGCIGTTTGGTLIPGRYKLSITTTAATTWNIGIWQQILPAGTPIVVDKIDGTSSVKVSSKGAARSEPFTVQTTAKTSPKGGVLAVVGEVAAQGAFAAYLVPVGAKLDPKRDLVYRQKSGDGGAFQAEVRTRGESREQTYILVVRAKGAWTVRFTTP